MTNKILTNKGIEEATKKEAPVEAKKEATKKEAPVEEYEVKNPLYSKATLEAIRKADGEYFTIEAMDKMLMSCDKKPQLNSMKKDNKVMLGSYYLLFTYKERVKRSLNEKIRRLKYDYEVCYDKELDKFTNDDIQQVYSSLKATKNLELKNISELIEELPTTLKINSLYATYCRYQLEKTGSSKKLYEDVYKIHIAQWLTRNNIEASEELLQYLANEVTMKSQKNISLKSDDSSSNLRILFSKSEFCQEFTKVLVDLMIKKGIINKKSYLGNKYFLESLDNLPSQRALKVLQEAIEKTDINIEEEASK